MILNRVRIHLEPSRIGVWAVCVVPEPEFDSEGGLVGWWAGGLGRVARQPSQDGVWFLLDGGGLRRRQLSTLGSASRRHTLESSGSHGNAMGWGRMYTTPATKYYEIKIT